jgi:hypothetical protein
MKEEVAYNKVLVCTNKALMMYAGRYLDKGEYKWFNPFQSNFSANRILPSSYLFIPAIFLQAQPREYNAQSPVHIKTQGLPRNRKSTTCAICWPKPVLHEEKRLTGSDSGVGAKKKSVGRGPTSDQKGLIGYL